eukprot:1106261-Rhodomonas_salina.2
MTHARANALGNSNAKAQRISAGESESTSQCQQQQSARHNCAEHHNRMQAPACNTKQKAHQLLQSIMMQQSIPKHTSMEG